VSELILISEALHEHRIAEIASLVMQRSKEARIVLVAGPSSSGKTTFSKRLTVQLLARASLLSRWSWTTISCLARRPQE